METGKRTGNENSTRPHLVCSKLELERSWALKSGFQSIMMTANRIRQATRSRPMGAGDIDGIKSYDWPVIEERSQINLHELDNFPRPARRKYEQQLQQGCSIKLAQRTPPRHLTSSLSPAKCSSLVAVLLVIYTASSIPASEGVDCFKCSSRNGTNPACEDPFHNTNTTRVQTATLPEPHPNVIYHTPCYAGKKGRDGLFPASACIKLTGTFDKTGETLVVRHCALDSGSLTQDTELARMSHCGKFQFEGDLLRGCVLACPEDACNSAFSALTQRGPFSSNEMLLIIIMCLSALLSLCSHNSKFKIGQLNQRA